MKSLALSVVVSLLVGAASAENSLVAPSIGGIVAAGTRIELVKEGFQGTEGPLGLPDGSLLFTETQANRVTRIAPDGTLSTFLENSNGSNGLALRENGEIVAVQTVRASVGVIYPSDRVKVLVEQFEGKPFGRPNDLVVDRKGNVYFTDPGARPEPGQPAPQTAVYRLASNGQVSRIDQGFERPNGIQLSPDEKTLYVANTGGEYIFAYDVAADGSVGKRRNFAKLAGFKQTENGWSSGADGLATDSQGRLYVASSIGVQIFDAQGQPLGVIELPKAPQNLAFAGKDKKTLYVVGRGAVYRLPVLAAGLGSRAK